MCDQNNRPDIEIEFFMHIDYIYHIDIAMECILPSTWMIDSDLPGSGKSGGDRKQIELQYMEISQHFSATQKSVQQKWQFGGIFSSLS